MSPLFLHDGRRLGALNWITDQITKGVAVGAVITPFDTPPAAGPRRPSATDYIHAVRAVGGEVLFDPATHGVLAPAANRFDIYDAWRLWSGTRGEREEAALRGHTKRVLQVQHRLGMAPRAPTLPLVSPAGQDADLALAMAEEALRQHGNAHVSVVGTGDFWSAGNALDAFVGQLAQMRPGGWMVSNFRPRMDYPWLGVTPGEVAGMCRSVHSMSMRSSVFIAQADFAALPSIAAGAATLGSGWDLRQRTCSADAYRTVDGVRRQSDRVAHEGLLAALKRQEAERLAQGDGQLSQRLIPGSLPPPGNAVWEHHLRVLARVAESVIAAGGRQQRVGRLRTLYSSAMADFQLAAPHAQPLEVGPARWIVPFSHGLEVYAAGEGF